MIFFKKKPKEEKVEFIPEMPKIAEELPLVPELPQHPEEEKMPKRQAAPLFVKIERYRAVLDMVNNLKETIFMLKHGFEIQKQLEGLKEDNRTSIESAIAKIEKKISDLDNEFTRPMGLEEEYPVAPYESENLNETLTELKKKINDLKSELKSIA